MSRSSPSGDAERSFWQPVPIAEAPGRYRLPASDEACIGIPGRRAPMGGVTSAAAITAMEHATGGALLWSTAQFVSPAPVETDFDIVVEVLGEGRTIQRARATLLDGEREILTASGALASFEESGGATFAAAPSVDAPADCRVLESPSSHVPDLFAQFERRLAMQDPEAGRQAVWFRPVSDQPVEAGLLAVLGDFISGAHPDTRGSIGFDNTLRVAARPPTEWILADIAITHIGDRVFHGSMRCYAESGELMAISSLTALRPRKREG